MRPAGALEFKMAEMMRNEDQLIKFVFMLHVCFVNRGSVTNKKQQGGDRCLSVMNTDGVCIRK